MHVCVDAVLYACVFAISVHVGERKKGTVTNHTTYYSSSVHESQVGVPSTAHYPHVSLPNHCRYDFPPKLAYNH